MSRRCAVIVLLVSAQAASVPPLSSQCPTGTPGDTAAVGRAYDELTVDQKRVFDSGGQVFVRRDVAGSPWPAVAVYQYIDASPEEAAAVFIDYERHQTYIPGVRKSHVSAVISSRTVEVDYVVRVPIVADEHYTVRNHLCAYESSKSYRVDWTLVRASSTKATTGNVRFEPYRGPRLGTRGTVMAYANVVTPGSRLAPLGIVKKRAMQQMRETAYAIVRRVETERATDATLLEKQVAAFRAALAP